MSETTLKWNEQPHSHICPLHNARRRCEIVPCPDRYMLVCDGDHPRELIQQYVTESTRRHNEDIREEQRGQRIAYDEGRQSAYTREDY